MGDPRETQALRQFGVTATTPNGDEIYFVVEDESKRRLVRRLTSTEQLNRVKRIVALPRAERSSPTEDGGAA